MLIYSVGDIQNQVEITESESDSFSNRINSVGKLVSVSLATTMASEKDRTCFEKGHVIRTDGKIENHFFQVLKLVALL